MNPQDETIELPALNAGNENHFFSKYHGKLLSGEYDEHEKASHSKLREAF
ncbi:hypothetical protein [Peribacillus frigoritolerans]|nr:hypothetical protein [Peribacillus castrilensis]